MNSRIHQYVRDNKGNVRGVLVAKNNPELRKIKFGWSCTNIKAGDRFNKKLGIQIAEARCSTNTNKKIPDFMKHHLHVFGERAQRYFKGSTPTLILEMRDL